MLMLARQTHFWPFLIIYFVYGLAFTPTFGLTNTLALAVVPNARRDFGGIRMWGTAGWVAIAWVFSLFWLRGGATPEARLPHAIYVSAIASLVLAAYSLTLPSSAKVTARPDTLMYWKALKLMTRPGFALLNVLTFLAAMTHQVYYYGMSPFLSQAGFANHLIMPAMSIGQLSEVFMLGALGVCLARISIKQALIIGLAAQAVRYFLFAAGTSPIVIMSGVSLHGLCYAFYFTSAYIYVDQHSTQETRAAAQQILTIVISGFGTFAAYVAGGYLGQALSMPDTGTIAFKLFWLIPAVGSAMLVVALALFFKEEAPVKVSEPVSVEA
jgi:MFS family permease